MEEGEGEGSGKEWKWKSERLVCVGKWGWRGKRGGKKGEGAKGNEWKSERGRERGRWRGVEVGRVGRKECWIGKDKRGERREGERGEKWEYKEPSGDLGRIDVVEFC